MAAKRIPEALTSTWPAMYRAGQTLDQIATASGVSGTTVHRYLSAVGLTWRKGGMPLVRKTKPRRVEVPGLPGVYAYAIPLSAGNLALVDECDLPLVTPYAWTATQNKKSTYAMRQDRTGTRGRRRNILLHRQIMSPDAGLVVDHINGDGLDNRRANLRVCTQKQNQQNVRRGLANSSGAKGVGVRKSGFTAKIKVEKKNIWLGTYRSLDEAARAYDIAALAYFGAFACLNFPNENGAGLQPGAVTDCSLSPDPSRLLHAHSFAAQQIEDGGG
jgi:hypothetical protein